MTDHQRFDTMNTIQAGREVTPNLNRLARESGWFERAYTTCPLCVPARTALATGVYPTSSGIVYNDWEDKTARPMITIHDMLKQSGYQVGHVGVDHVRVLPPLRERGFDFFYSHEEYESMARERGLVLKDQEDIAYVKEKCGLDISSRGYSGVRVSRWEYPMEVFKDFCFLGQAAAFLEQVEDDRPFALFVYLWAPHPPLKVPGLYADMYPPSEVKLPENVGVPAENEPESRRAGAAAQLAEGVSKEHWKQVWASYLGLTSMADDIVGKLLDKIERLGKKEDTAIVFTADHGDNLGQHGMYQKMEMYEACIHIPLIIHLPGYPGVKVKQLVSHLDLAPTIGALIREEHGAWEGISLLEAVKTGQMQSREAVFSQYSGTYDYGFIRRAVITENDKYIYDDWGIKEYYRLDQDPEEMNNRADDPACDERVNWLHQCCKSYHQNHGDYFNWRQT